MSGRRVGVVYALHRVSGDFFPIFLRGDCDRTFFNPLTGKDEGLAELIVRYDSRGWDIVFAPPRRSP